MKNFFLIILATLMLFSCSCQKAPGGEDVSFEPETVKQPEPQYMAYRLGEVMRLGEDIYFAKSASFTKAQIFATEYGSENFDVYVPCFDAVCDHRDRLQCCLKTYEQVELFTAFLDDGEPAMLLYEEINTCLSKPYSNVKTDLLRQDFMFIEDEKERTLAKIAWKKSESYPIRSEQLVYKDYFYYVELKSGVRTQYRISLDGGEPERVFEEDNIIIRTIINDRFYGIRYENVDPNDPWGVMQDRDSIHYFRSDMNYENVEPLPDKLYCFQLRNDIGVSITFSPNSNAIIDADEEFIYIMNGMKFWAIPDSDINAEPILLSDMKDKIPYERSFGFWQTTWYGDGVLYTVLHSGIYERDLLDHNGQSMRPTQWYEKSTLYSFDIRTGEYSSRDISGESYLLSEFLYADGEYIYAKCKYAHNDGRMLGGATMRLTLDTMRYEVILPDRFLEYSAETDSN